jgi:thiol-disulfide isomerase/thioredoxin
MKKILILLVAITCFSCSQAQKNEFSKEALTETLLSESGKQIPFADILKNHSGKTILIEVWASWCGDCIKAMPTIKEFQTKYPKVDYVFISMDKTADKWRDGIEKYDIEGDHYMANDQMKGVFGKAIDLDWIPRYIIIDKSGKIVIYRAIETDFEKINATLTGLENVNQKNK